MSEHNSIVKIMFILAKKHQNVKEHNSIDVPCLCLVFIESPMSKFPSLNLSSSFHFVSLAFNCLIFVSSFVVLSSTVCSCILFMSSCSGFLHRSFILCFIFVLCFHVISIFLFIFLLCFHVCLNFFFLYFCFVFLFFFSRCWVDSSSFHFKFLSITSSSIISY